MCQNPQMALFSGMRAWEAQERPSAFTGLQSLDLLHICSLCLAPAASPQWTNGMAKQNGGTEETRSFQVHNSRISLGKLSWRELGGGYKQQITELGSNLQQNTCISTPIMQPPSNAFSGRGFYNQDLEVAEDFRWQENRHRGSCAGRWGLELFLNVNSINLH